MTNTSTYFRALIGLHTRSPLHAGVMGGDHVIDRPIHRDVHTKVPKVSSNALKGALREQGVAHNAKDLFGDSEWSAEDVNPQSGRPGLISFTDARLLLFPVYSKVGGWAWVTCPDILSKFKEESSMAGIESDNEASNFFYQALYNAIGDQAIYAGEKLKIEDHVLLYRHKFPIEDRLTKQQIDDWQSAIPNLKNLESLSERMVILSDENFRELTLQYTETITRNKISDATGTVAGGALFTEEYLPANSVLYTLAFSMPDQKQQEIERKIKTNITYIQLAGNATLGKGLCELKWYFPQSEISRVS